MKEEVTAGVTLNEQQSIYFSKLLCLPFVIESVLVSVRYTFDRGFSGTYNAPPEPASVELYDVCFEGYFTEQGELLEITNKQAELLQYHRDYIVDVHELEAICFEHHYEEEDTNIMEQASHLYDDTL